MYTCSDVIKIIPTVCPLGYLGTPSSKQCFCFGGNLSLDIPNGCVCYNGIMTGSQASVKCNAGYQLQGNSTLVCQGDGLWSGVQPMCSKQAPPTGNIHVPIQTCMDIAHMYKACWWGCNYQMGGHFRKVAT